MANTSPILSLCILTSSLGVYPRCPMPLLILFPLAGFPFPFWALSSRLLILSLDLISSRKPSPIPHSLAELGATPLGSYTIKGICLMASNYS